MPESLSDDLLAKKAVLEKFIADELCQWEAEAQDADRSALRELRQRVAKRSAELGIFQMSQPRSVGGTAATQLELLVMQETLARANLSTLSGAVFGGGAGPMSGATGRLREEYVRCAFYQFVIDQLANSLRSWTRCSRGRSAALLGSQSRVAKSHARELFRSKAFRS